MKSTKVLLSVFFAAILFAVAAPPVVWGQELLGLGRIRNFSDPDAGGVRVTDNRGDNRPAMAMKLLQEHDRGVADVRVAGGSAGITIPTPGAIIRLEDSLTGRRLFVFAGSVPAGGTVYSTIYTGYGQAWRQGGFYFSNGLSFAAWALFDFIPSSTMLPPGPVILEVTVFGGKDGPASVLAILAGTTDSLPRVDGAVQLPDKIVIFGVFSRWLTPHISFGTLEVPNEAVTFDSGSISISLRNPFFNSFYVIGGEAKITVTVCSDYCSSGTLTYRQ
jgi:hypothetical protein